MEREMQHSLFHPLVTPQYSPEYSIFSPKKLAPISPFSPASSISSPSDDYLSATSDRLYLAGLRLQHQDFSNRYDLCLSHLQDAARQAELLRLENAQLRIRNGQLSKRISNGSGIARMESLENEMRKLRIQREKVMEMLPPASVNSLPKSIAVRSNGYKNMKGGSGSGSSRDGKVRVSKPITLGSQQHVFVADGGEEQEQRQLQQKRQQAAQSSEERALELEVYNQGMFKTELCNKWQETGECPYGEHCQFAHGLDELRPVIRHPRYKTEVCRMVLAGDRCLYGHRCHFRHALNPSEMLLMQSSRK